MSAPDRGAYAARQARLLDALLHGEGFPEGFAAAQAAAAGSALRRKRAHAVARAWPALALRLGETFDARFDAFTRGAGADAPPSGDPLRDGLAFARWIAAGGEPVGDNVRVEMLLARAALRHRGPWVRTAWLQWPYRRLLVVVRLPRAGVQGRSFAFGRARRGCWSDKIAIWTGNREDDIIVPRAAGVDPFHGET